MPKNRYTQIIESIFLKHYTDRADRVLFERTEFVHAAEEMHIPLPRNLGDVVYSFRYRAELPESIRNTAPEGYEWAISPAGIGRYQFILVTKARIVPNEMLAETKIPDATPGVIERYALNDEQALLAKLRYNRLIDIFTGLACYSLQSHLRTTVPGMGQVETDELYVGIDRRGAHYILPVQAKGRSDTVGVVQIQQDLAVCAAKFPALLCRPLAAQFLGDDLIALFELEQAENGIAITCEKHYRLVDAGDLSPEELASYQQRPV